MTNIREDMSMEKLRGAAHSPTHHITFVCAPGDKEFYQKMWLIGRYARELGFKRCDRS